MQLHRIYLWTALFIFLITFVGDVRADDCPDAEDILPCTCSNQEEGLTINCGEAPLFEMVRAFDRLRGLHIHKAILDRPLVPFIPERLFRQTNLTHLLLYGLSIDSFQGPKPNKSPFLGVEDTLQTIEILWPVDGKGKFNWTDLTVLRNLKELRILGLHLKTVGPFPPINSLTILTMQHTETETLADDAFVNLPNLERINLQDNLLTTVKRSMFVPNSKLQRINLSANKLVAVPTDMFTDMPDLEILTIAYNRIRNLPLQPFQIYNQLTIDFSGNRVFCTCDLKWMRDMAKVGKLKFQGECHNVQNIHGRNILTFFKKCK